MNDFNQELYKLGLQQIIERYVKFYFDLHGDILPVEGLYFSMMEEIERPLIQETLRRLKGNQVQAAKLLGINRNTLRRKIKDLKISLETI